MAVRIRKQKSGFFFILPSLFLALVAGCVSTTDFDSMNADLARLKRETAELRKETSDLKSEMRGQLAGVAKEESFNAVRESQASLLSQVSEVSRDIQNLRGRFDENKFYVDKMLRDSATERELLRSQISALESRVRELADKIAKFGGSSPSAKEAEKEEIREEPDRGKELPAVPPRIAGKEDGDQDPLRVYEAAYNLFKEKKYKEAREKFNDFIRRFPKDDLAGNAQFWIGETYYAEKDFEGAILAYEALIRAHPNSPKIAGALLKQGLAFFELDDKKTAKVIFQKLLEKYPDSKEAETARKKTAEMDKKPARTKPKR